MPSKRASPGSDSSDSSDSGLGSKRPRIEQGLFSGIGFYFIQTKIEPTELDLLYSLAESNSGDVDCNIQQADMIITRISMRKRLERHIPWELAKQKAVVTPAWITQSVAKKKRLSCGEYTAVCSLERCTVEHCPEHGAQPCGSNRSSVPPPTPPKNLSHTARFAVERASPLICPNQELLIQLKAIRDARALDGNERSALSYSRSISVLKAYPHLIRSADQVSHLPFVGPKISSMIQEYISIGQISEAKRVSTNARYFSLTEFTRIHGIGSPTARNLYDAGCRTLEDLDRRYGAEYRNIGQPTLPVDDASSGIRVALELRDDLSIPMPRDEVEEIDRIISKELDELEPGCMHTICGGYRRGKTQCNDVDIVFTHPQKEKQRGLCERLVERLKAKGLIIYVLNLFSFRSSNPTRPPADASRPGRTHLDTLDKSLVIFRLPAVGDSGARRLYRRVDLIFSPMETYWTAVVGWTGSTMFERDLRLWAKQKMGMKFDSAGITRRRDTKEYFPMSEAAVFEILGLEWIDPTLRNADA